MPSKRAEPRAIAAQLVWLFTLAAALLLSCGLGIFYWMVVRHAFAEDNAILVDKVSAVAAELQRLGPNDALRDQIQTTRTKEPRFLYLRLLDPANRIVAETPQMDRLAPPDQFPPAGPRAFAPESYRSAGQLFYLLATTVEFEGRTYTIQVAQDRSEDEKFRQEFGVLFLIVLVAGVVAAGIIAVTVTNRGLQPLTKLERSLERVGPSKLHERIESGNWPAELQPVVTAFNDMLARLEDSFARLSQFSADLAHELRTPVGNILGEAQVTLTKARSSEEYQAALESTVTECERLSLIVDNLLFLARAEAHESPLERKNMNGRLAAEKIAAYYETLAEDRGVTIRCQGDAEISADPVLFERALGNLVENALRFVPERGEIVIGVKPETDHVRVSVSDNGSGIPKEAQARVFDRFFRADPSRTSGGTGLGLSLVRSIMELHGGSAGIESEPGRGTTAALLFPNPLN